MTTFLTARRYLGFVSLILSLLTLSAPSAMATHLRGGTLTWTVVNSGDPSQFIVQFTFQYSQRWSYPNSPGVCSAGSACPALNTTIDLSTLSGGGLFAPGDGTFLDPTGTITAVNQAEDWCDATFVFNYVYSTSQSQYTAYFYDASRISTLQINANANEYIGTTVSNYAGGAPVASIPSMVAVPIGPVIVNLAPFVADIDPNAYLYFRLSTLDEMLGPGSSAVLCPDGMTLYQLNGVSLWQPPGLAISTSGRMTWDISQIQQASCGFAFPQAGDLWATQIIVEALDSSANLLSETPIDFILKFELPNGSLPTITLNPAGPQTVKTGTPVSFTATANSSNPLAKVTLNAVGVPAGASATNLNTALTPPQSSTFSWTPSQAGTYVVAYTVTDNNFQQASASETIIVAAAPPTISCSSPISVQYGQSGTLSASVFDPNNQLLSVV